MSTDDATAHDRRWRYRKLLRTIAYQTGHPQPVMCSARTLWTTLVANGSVDHHDAKSALRAARENDHVVRRETDDDVWYGVTTDGIDAVEELSRPLFEPADESKVREILTAEVGSDEPNKRLIGWCNSRLEEMDT